MFCVKKADNKDKYKMEKDPLASTTQTDSDDEPTAKKPKFHSPPLKLQVFNIPSFTIPKSLSIFPTTPTSTLPMFVNNPLNLANPLSLTTNGKFEPVKRYSLPSKLPITITPTKTQPISKVVFDSGGSIVRYKKNGEVAKKRGPPKGYKRKPKTDALTAANNAAGNQPVAGAAPSPRLAQHETTGPAAVAAPPPPAVPQYFVPPGVEHIQLQLDPADWYPDEPFKMLYSRKKNPKWKAFPHRCEHCFKGYRVSTTLVAHCAARHGCAPRALAAACPACPHVSLSRRQHRAHLRTHRLACPHCDVTDEPAKVFSSEESLRLHRKRKHPHVALFNKGWYCTWTDRQPNS